MPLAIDLSGRTALVTGAARGIGFGIAEMLARAGARVAVNDISLDDATSAAARIGPSALAIAGDVSSETDADAIIAAANAQGDLDILVNNAGVSEPLAGIRRQQVEDWQRVIDVNLRGTYLMCRALARARTGRPGAIVNIASVAGLAGFPASHGYGVSKAAIVMLTKTLACEFARYHVRVNAVAPGVIDAPMLAEISSTPASHAALLQRVPMGRLGGTHEIGATVAFLCSDAASYITGAIVPVDGGWLAWGGAGAASTPQTT
jgi:NAD(P)-dependent dehydrogenase (short-subunit alcohol dehydrogenase family)